MPRSSGHSGAGRVLRSGASVAAGRAAAHRYSHHALASVMRAAGLPSPNTWYWSRSARALPAGAIRTSAHPERCRVGLRCRASRRVDGPHTAAVRAAACRGVIRAPALPERCRSAAVSGVAPCRRPAHRRGPGGGSRVFLWSCPSLPQRFRGHRGEPGEAPGQPRTGRRQGRASWCEARLVRGCCQWIWARRWVASLPGWVEVLLSRGREGPVAGLWGVRRIGWRLKRTAGAKRAMRGETK
jgi:hypothetical protein